MPATVRGFMVGIVAGACSGCAGGCIQQTFVAVGKPGREELPDTLLGPETTGPLILVVAVG